MPYRSVLRPGLFAGQTIVVTGGGSGIGEATATRLVRDGAHVMICGRTEEKLAGAVDRMQAAAAEAAAAGPNLVVCRRQVAPARKVPNLVGIPIVIVTGEASYHAAYDHCTSAYLTQAGVANDHMRLEAKGIRGNGHGMPGEKNNLVVAGAIKDWLRSKGL